MSAWVDSVQLMFVLRGQFIWVDLGGSWWIFGGSWWILCGSWWLVGGSCVDLEGILRGSCLISGSWWILVDRGGH